MESSLYSVEAMYQAALLITYYSTTVTYTACPHFVYTYIYMYVQFLCDKYQCTLILYLHFDWSVHVYM